MSKVEDTGNEGHGHHHAASEVKVVLGDNYTVLVAKHTDTLASIKERALIGLELGRDDCGGYVLHFKGQDIEDESQTLEHLQKEHSGRHMEFQLRRRHHPTPDVVVVTVKYVGNADYHHPFPAAATFHDIKLKAMQHFGLEASAANKYALQHDKADLPENGHVGSLGEKKVTLTLVLVHEVPKGCGRA